MIKRYMVFSYDQYYPGGGSGDTIEKIFSSIKEIIEYKPNYGWCEYVEVLDLNSGEWLDFDRDDIEAGYWLKNNIELKPDPKKLA